MKLPIIREGKNYKKQVVTFGGINYTQNFSEGELSSAVGISHLCFPALTQKRKSVKVEKYIKPSWAGFADREYVCDSSAFYYDEKKVGELLQEVDCAAVMGSIIAVFPDKMYYNTKTDKFGSMEAEHIFNEVSVTMTENSLSAPEFFYRLESCIEETTISEETTFNVYETVSVNNDAVSLSAVTEKEAAELVQNDITDFYCESNQYRIIIEAVADDNSNMYNIKSELYTAKKIYTAEFTDFKVGDAVEISGCTQNSSNNKRVIVQEINGRRLIFAENTFTAGTEVGVTVKRKVPNFRCVCSYENRLWGCEGNTIYASKLGDPFNFFVYNSISTDSFTIESNTAGDFIACLPFGNCCIFFKENAIYKLYGSKPSNFQLVEGLGEGIENSNGRSLAETCGKIFYCGFNGVYMYCGGIPQLISQGLGNLKMRNAAGGTDGKSYFLAFDSDSGRKLYVYDIEKGLWSVEGVTKTTAFSFYEGQLYKICTDGMYKTEEIADGDTEWSVTLCPFDENYYKTKNYSRLWICARLSENAWLRVETSADDGPWQDACTIHACKKEHISIPVRRRSCHELTVRVSGKGKCLLESIVREFSVN